MPGPNTLTNDERLGAPTSIGRISTQLYILGFSCLLSAGRARAWPVTYISVEKAMRLFNLFRKNSTSAWDILQKHPAFRQQKELFEAMSVLCEHGVDADEMPNGSGDFGMTQSNPIPCRTIFGSTSYLSRLRAPDGAKIIYKRIGSFTSGVSPHQVDAYEVSHPDGEKLATLFISAYQKRTSGKPPRGFTLVGVGHCDN